MKRSLTFHNVGHYSLECISPDKCFSNTNRMIYILISRVKRDGVLRLQYPDGSINYDIFYINLFSYIKQFAYL